VGAGPRAGERVRRAQEGAIDAGREADEHLTALYKMQEWIAAGIQGPDETILQRHAYDMREKAERD
jgi:hypothetical protein